MSMENIGGTTIEDNQKILLEYYKNNVTNGIFYVPELGVYSADILVNNPHPVIVVNEGEDLRGHKISYIENDESLGYLTGEISFIFNKRVVGSIYEYTVDGVESHSHTFKEVLEECCRYGDRLVAISEYGDYSKQELELLEHTSKYRDLNLIKRYFKLPYVLRGKKLFTNDIEELYAIVVNNYEDIFVVFNDKYYNKNQIEIIETIIKYQKYEKEKNMGTREILLNGLPDSRISKYATKITVVSFNGTHIILKDRGIEGEGSFILDETNKFADGIDMEYILENIAGKDVKIYPEFYSNKQAIELLKKI